MADQSAGRSQDSERMLRESTETALFCVENLLKQMGVALRSLRLYPPDNPIPSQAVKKFHQLLEDFLQKEGVLRIGVTKGGFGFGDKAVGQKNAVLTNLALELYVRSIGQISFYIGVGIQELSSFLAMVNLGLFEIKSRGGMANLLWDNDISNITIRELTTHIVDAESDASITPTEGMVMAEPEVILINRLLGERTFEHAQRRVLLRLVGQLEEIKSYFQGLSELQPRVGEENLESEVENLYEIARKLGLLISEELLDEQPRLFRNLAESLLLLDDQTRSSLFGKKLISNLDTDETAFELLSQLSARELAELLTSIARSMPESAIRFSEILEQLPGFAEDEEEFLNLMREGLKSAGLTEEKFAFLQRERGSEVSEEALLLEEAPMVEELPILKVASQLGRFSKEERESIARIAQIDERSITVHVVATLTDLLYLAKNFECFSRAMEQLEEAMSLLLKQGEFSLAANVLKALRELVNLKSDYLKYEERIRQALAKSSSPTNVGLLISALRPLNAAEEKYRQIISCLTLLNHQEVILVLLESLATEKQRSLRKTICDLLANLGKFDLGSLGAYVSDQRWYVVRNIALIFGLIGSQEALPYLRKILKHPDSRVRLEAIRALGQIKGESTIDLLIPLTSDREQSIQLAAINCLSRIKSPQAIPHLRRIARKRDLMGKNLLLQLEAVKALGAFSSDKVLPTLEELLRRRVWFGKARNKKLRKQAYRVLEELGTPEATNILRRVEKP